MSSKTAGGPILLLHHDGVSVAGQLDALGWPVHAFATGDQAVSRLIPGRFVLILIDADHPSRELLLTAALLRCPQIPVVLLGSPNGPSPGASATLAPPYTTERLKSMLEQFGTRTRRRTGTRSRRRVAAEMLMRLCHDLQLAQGWQSNLIPASLQLPGFELWGMLEPAHQIGGDFYDVIADREQALLVIGDVMGKGLVAGMMMTLTLALLREVARLHRSPADLLRAVNVRLAEHMRHFDDYHTVSVLVAAVDLATRRVRFAKAGHELPIWWRKSAGVAVAVEIPGLLLGVDPTFRYSEVEVTLEPGDRLLLFTDGVPDTRDAAQEFYGVKRLEALLQRHGAAPPDRIVEAVLRSVASYRATVLQPDDIALLAVGAS